ncbi:hypothetical protein [Micromonospora sp. NPDC005324]|uniref:hypothetical protein n=1 Tax=Micromonospora sp. NPDC005324 TaxID=3157033 RepID=UPI0033B20589
MNSHPEEWLDRRRAVTRTSRLRLTLSRGLISDSFGRIHVRRRCDLLIGMWNTLQVNVSLDDLLARPAIGPGYRTRDEAHAQVQQFLDADPALGRAAGQWRMDVQRVRVGSQTWTIYEYDDEPQKAALTWLNEYLRSFREAGVSIRVATLSS